jgi:hypothetical protein
VADRQLTQTEADALARCCILYADRKGKTIAREESSVHSARHVRYAGDDFTILAKVLVSSKSSGGFSLTVFADKRMLFSASGNLKTAPCGTQVQRFVAGPWVRTVQLFAARIEASDT